MAMPQAESIGPFDVSFVAPYDGDAHMLEQAGAAAPSWDHEPLGLRLTAHLAPDGWTLRISTGLFQECDYDSWEPYDYDPVDDDPGEDDHHELDDPVPPEEQEPPPLGANELEIQVRLTPAIEVTLRGTIPTELMPQAPATLTLCRGVPYWKGWRDVTATPYGQLYRHVWGVNAGFGRTPVGHQRALALLFRRLNDHLVARCEPAARKAALRFNQYTRRFVYSAIVRDPTGRVLQASRLTPGVVAFAAEAELVGLGEVSAAVWKALAAGRRVRDVIREGLRELLEARGLEMSAQWVDGDARATLDNPRYRFDQRRFSWYQAHAHLHELLIRRSVARAPRGLLLEPVPVGVRAEDLPTDRPGQRSLALAFERLRRFEREPWLEEAQLPALAGYLVQNPQSPTLDTRLELWLRAGHRVGRLTDGVALRRRLREMRPQPPDALEPLTDEQLGENVVFPPPLLPGFRTEKNWLEPLLDRHSLEQEGHAMRHCVGSYSRAAELGGASYYRGEIFGYRVTLELLEMSGIFLVRQLQCVANLRPPKRVREAVDAWAFERRWEGG